MSTVAAATDAAEVCTAVRRFLEDNFLLEARAASLGDDDSFIEHQVLDSTGFMELVAWIEETYAFKVADDEMLPENLDSLAAVAAYVARKRAAA
ncbi:MAG: acyl carrier protein [Burkholderiaceae bacterium]|nr:acyl carrier protein [Burkholderiaceae bacterium]